MNWSFADVADVPPGVVTVMSTVVPAVPPGLVAVIEVALLTTNVAVERPNFTDVTPVKPVPVMATEVPPAGGPAVGVMLVTVGAP